MCYYKSKRFVALFIAFTVLLVSIKSVYAGLRPIFNAKERHMERVLAGDRIYGGITAGGVDIGGLTRDEAKRKLLEVFEAPLLETVLTLTDGQTTMSLSLDQLGAGYDIGLAVETAYAYGRLGGFKERYKQVSALKETPVDIPVAYAVDQAVLDGGLAAISNRFDISPTDARLSLTAGKFKAESEVYGRRLDMDNLEAQLADMLSDRLGGAVTLVFEAVAPRFTAQTLMQKATSLLGSYETPLDTSDANRLQNVRLAAARLNGTVVMPGQVFSTVAQIKPNDSAYLPAGAYLQGKIVDSVGGGVCQAVSTLYMALLYAELDIVERQNHSMPVGYVDYAFDATMAEGLIDLRFKNNTDYPVILESNVSQDRLWVNVYGHEGRPAERRLTFENELVSTTLPEAELVTYDPSMPQSHRVVEIIERSGYTFRLYKLVYMNGALTDRVLVNTSVYSPVRGHVRVGAKD